VPGSSRRSFPSRRMEPLPSAIRSNPVQACISREDEHPGISLQFLVCCLQLTKLSIWQYYE
jgi:hypothetical protein